MEKVNLCILSFPDTNCRSLIPWININIFPFETIFAVKFECVQHALFDGLDIDDLLLLSLDKSIIFSDNKPINHYKHHLKNKQDINAVYLNKFSNGWSSTGPIEQLFKHQKYRKIIKIMDRLNHNNFGYFDNLTKAMDQISPSLHINKTSQLFISTQNNHIFTINDIFDTIHDEFEVFDGSKPFIPKTYKMACNFTKFVINNAYNTWIDHLSAIIAGYIWSDITEWKISSVLSEYDAFNKGYSDYRFTIYPSITPRDIFEIMKLKDHVLINKNTKQDVTNKTFYELNLFHNDWKTDFYTKYRAKWKLDKLCDHQFEEEKSEDVLFVMIRNEDGSNDPIFVPRTQTIWEFKCTLQEIKGISPNNMLLVCKGHRLHDGKTFSQYQFGNCFPTIYFLQRLFGG